MPCVQCCRKMPKMLVFFLHPIQGWNWGDPKTDPNFDTRRPGDSGDIKHDWGIHWKKWRSFHGKINSQWDVVHCHVLILRAYIQLF